MVSGSLDLIDVTTGTDVNLNTSSGTIGLPDLTGTVSIFVNSGDTIEIQAFTSNFDYQNSVNGDVTLTNIATAAVPEPMSMALFGVGLAGLGLLRRERA